MAPPPMGVDLSGTSCKRCGNVTRQAAARPRHLPGNKGAKHHGDCSNPLLAHNTHGLGRAQNAQPRNDDRDPDRSLTTTAAATTNMTRALVRNVERYSTPPALVSNWRCRSICTVTLMPMMSCLRRCAAQMLALLSVLYAPDVRLEASTSTATGSLSLLCGASPSLALPLPAALPPPLPPPLKATELPMAVSIEPADAKLRLESMVLPVMSCRTTCSSRSVMRGGSSSRPWSSKRWSEEPSVLECVDGRESMELAVLNIAGGGGVTP